MEAQTIINISIGLVGALGGWVLNNLKSSIDELRKQDSLLADKVQHIEVLVAGTYVKRDDMDKLGSALFAKLDKIEAKLDGKADK
ncbi:hypothetical protein [Methylotenera sp.]|uniref:hypothetical protein n=1 Tax=Methylotenera sp. TaxID=2051956 RepID=UPI002ED78B96